jgi:hypothetical protein
MLRALSDEGRAKYFLSLWLQNGQGNYVYDAKKNRVTINNFHQWQGDFSVTRLPTDSAGLSEFISEVEGRASLLEPVSEGGKNFLVISKFNRASERYVSQRMIS